MKPLLFIDLPACAFIAACIVGSAGLDLMWWPILALAMFCVTLLALVVRLKNRIEVLERAAGRCVASLRPVIEERF